MREISDTERLLRRIEWISGILLVCVTLGAVVWLSPRTALSILLGGAIVIVSFQILKWQLRKAFQSPGRIPTKGRLFAAYYLRFLATMFVVFVVIYYEWADPIPFLVGLSLMVLSIVLGGGIELIAMAARKGEG